MTDIFIAYSHEDLAHKQELKKFLRPLLREGRASVWDDHDIEAGQEWDAAIKERLYGAGVVLLLVSADSLASDYFYGKEVQVSLERHQRGEVVVVPVVLRHCDWENTPLGVLEALPEKGRPVVDWPTRDQAWQNVVSRLRRVLDGIEARRTEASVQAEQKRRYAAALESGKHLFERGQWAEAGKSFGHALAFFQPGFVPEKSWVEQQIVACEQHLRAEQERAAAERRQKDADARRQKSAEQRTDSGDSAALEKSIVRRLIVGALAVLALAVVVWIGTRPERQPSRKEPAPNTAAPLHPLEDAAYDKALKKSTLAALERFLEQYPAGKNAPAARQKLVDLLLADARLLHDDDPDTACANLRRALKLVPGHAEAERLRRQWRCR